MQVLVLLVVFCLVARAEEDSPDSNWRTISASGRRYLHPPPVPHGAADAAATKTTSIASIPPSDVKNLHSSPVATNYYPSRRDPDAVSDKIQGEPGDPVSLAQPTRYHYYPHNQHVYLLPECAIQQVCNAVYVRLNYTQPLCACPTGHRDPCSASLRSDDLHTTELITDKRLGKPLTLVKTCEPVAEMRECRAPRDWSLLALQNVRTGKSHYLVICRCPGDNALEGPMSHDQPTYASVPGIRVFGMMCVRQTVTKFRAARPLRVRRELLGPKPLLPWHKVRQVADRLGWSRR
ncbi:uncharacterized protein LOC132205248 [Neocloeon triangulifer]|uniref:uncharacterized protein LOC132205248 n=1 Tax=Neocloeon triangulifer TaxID=2078957 RepID=UPI00286F034E|nr:uncharacterized protein LOC132205248 [Neocloeon triangulifer]